MIETHLDAMLSAAKEETLEWRYLKAKETFLNEKLARLQEALDFKKVSPDIGFLIMVLYIFKFIEEVGKKYSGHIISSLSFTGWPLNLFKSVLEKDGFEEKVNFAVSMNYKSLDAATHANTAKLVSKIWVDLGLDRRYEDEIEKVIEEKKRLYATIGSKPDLKRRELVRQLAAKGGKRASLNLLNIGLIPTELCPNSCRFCLAAWKSPVEERRGRALSEEEFKKIADQVIELASKKNLIITITGGEPLLELRRVLYILRNADTEVQLSTSGAWAGSKERAEEILEKFCGEIKRNKNQKFSFSLQLSVDAFHQEIVLKNGKLRESIPVSNIVNVMEAAQKRNIEVCLLPKYTIYEDPLAALLLELKKRNFGAEIVDKQYDPGFRVPVLKDGRLEIKPALLKAYLKFKDSKVLINYSAVENIGRASAMEDFEFPVFRKHVEDFLTRGLYSGMPLAGLEVSDDGNVYPGAHSLYSWCVGNVLETNLEEICGLLEYDPLIIAMSENPAKIKNIALELKPKIAEELKRASSPLAALHKILEDAEMRLQITKKLNLSIQ